MLAATLKRALAQPKISKVAVNYQDHPDGDKRCDRCVQFQPPDACKVVDGSISPQGSCRIFVPRIIAAPAAPAVPSIARRESGADQLLGLSAMVPSLGVDPSIH